MPTIDDFLLRTGRDLVRAFADSHLSPHPGHQGSIKEEQARAQLTSFLPAYMLAGQGYVIDSHGAESRQTDIILYERDFCPRLNLGSQESSYFPCEGVSAVGEVKSGLDKTALRDSYEKISAVKRLRRNPLRRSFRKYGSSSAVSAEGSSVLLNPLSPHFQIMGFVICERFTNSARSVMENMNEFDAEFGEILGPNIVISLNDGVLARGIFDGDQSRLVWSPNEANAVFHLQLEGANFGFLINQLIRHMEEGHTTAEPPLRPYLGRYSDFTIADGIRRQVVPVPMTDLPGAQL